MSPTVIHSPAFYLDFSRYLGCWPSFTCTCSFTHLLRETCGCDKTVPVLFKYWIWSVIVYLVVILGSVMTLFFTLSRNKFLGTKDVILAVEGVTHVACSSVALLMSVLQGTKFRKFLEEVRALDRYIVKSEYKSSLNLAVMAIAWCAVVATVYVFCGIPYTDAHIVVYNNSSFPGVTSMILMSLITVYPVVLMLQFALLAFSLSQRFKMLYQNMKNPIADLDLFRMVHHNLCMLSKKLGDLHSPIFFLIITSELFIIIVNVYAVIDGDISYYWSSFRIFDCTTHLLVTLWAADYLNNQAAEIENVVRGCQLSSFNMENQIKLILLMTGDHRKNVQTMASGFYAVTLGLFPSIIASSVTYLIVILQSSSNKC